MKGKNKWLVALLAAAAAIAAVLEPRLAPVVELLPDVLAAEPPVVAVRFGS